MPGQRDHEPVVIESFNGLWARGDAESCPLDHFTQADNIQFFHSGFQTRDAVDKYQTNVTPIGRIVRIYNYVMQTGQSLLVLREGGDIFHVVSPTVTHGPILSIAAMTDFGFVSVAGRAYITPFTSTVNAQGINSELGLQNDFVYVYKGDGTLARKAAGFPPVNGGRLPFVAFNSATDGAVTKGVHVIAVSFDGGQLGPEIFAVVETPGDKQIQLTNIPIGPLGTASRTIVMTHAIDPKDYKADQTSYTYYTALVIADNTTVNQKLNVTDAALVAVYAPGVGLPPAPGALILQNTDNDGFVDFGFHLVGVVYETDTGYLTAPGPEFFAGMSFIDVKKAVKVRNIPISSNTFVTKRHLVATKWIPEYNGDQKGFQFFFIPEGNIDNNTDTEKEVSFYDSDLLSDASHLIDNFSEIKAGVNLNTYHGRMVLVGEFANSSLARISAPGEPEAINQVDGLIIAPLDGNPLTNAQEFRDILYLFKKTRTLAYSDNNDEPSSWEVDIIDQAVGAPVHGIATVLDSGGVNVDFLLIADISGFMLFNGTYARPELSWKIEDFWLSLTKNDFRFIQVVNDSINKKIWITLPPPIRHVMLFADYGNGLDAKNIRWAKWIFDSKIATATLIEINKLVLGALELASA